MEFNFFGPTKIAKSLRAIAAKFDEKIQENAEKLIAKYQPEMQKIVDTYRPRLEGKKVMLYVGGLRPRHTIGAYEDLGMEIVGTGYEFAHNADYERTYEQLAKGTVIFDDVSEIEMEKFAEKLRPDLVGSGIKEKYVFQKAGIPFRQMHSWDYSGPYHGYLGFPVFARDIDMAINNPSWGLVKAPF
jgi:nitrogenase molybdenum-iron protein alpha chain